LNLILNPNNHQSSFFPLEASRKPDRKQETRNKKQGVGEIMSKIVPQDEEIVEQIKLLRDAVPPIIGYKKVEGTSPPCPCPCPCSPEK